MNREGAKLILKTWVECPVCFGNQNCPKDEERHCKAWCWSQNEVKEAVGVMLNDNKVTGWIPVSERMPEVEGRYIVTLDNDEVGYLLCKNCLWMVNNVVPLAECRVKAWMPLPEPCKAE